MSVYFLGARISFLKPWSQTAVMVVDDHQPNRQICLWLQGEDSKMSDQTCARRRIPQEPCLAQEAPVRCGLHLYQKSRETQKISPRDKNQVSRKEATNPDFYTKVLQNSSSSPCRAGETRKVLTSLKRWLKEHGFRFIRNWGHFWNLACRGGTDFIWTVKDSRLLVLQIQKGHNWSFKL